MSHDVKNRLTSRTARFESLEERLALNASGPCLDDAVYCCPVAEESELEPASEPIDLTSALDSTSALTAQTTQDVYYLREGSTVMLECANEETDLRYFWNLTGSATDSTADYREGQRIEQLSTNGFGLDASYPLRLIVMDASGALSDPYEFQVSVQPAQSAFEVSVETVLDGLGVVLTIDARGADQIATWEIDWGDDDATEVQALGDSITVTHVFPELYEDAAYTISLITVDSQGRVSEDVYDLATIDVAASDPIKTYVAESFYDAEKGSYTQSRICWAAGTANVLYATGWASSATMDQGGTEISFSSEDDVYEYLVANFDNIGSSALYGYEWFLTGDYPAYGLSGWSQPELGSGGFYCDTLTNYRSLVKYYAYQGYDSDSQYFADVASKLEKGWGSTISLAFYESTPGSRVTLAHTVTLWGFEYDDTLDADDPARYTAIYISDSDNDCYKGRNAPNTLSKIHIQWSDEYDRYELTDYYSGECWIAEFIMLAPKSMGQFKSTTSNATLDEAFASYSTDAAALLAELDEIDDDRLETFC